MEHFYMIYAEGHNAPTKKFESREDAEREARRISNKENCTVFILTDKNEIQPDNIMSRVKTFEDAMQVVGENAKEFEKICERLSPDEIAYKKLKIIAEALNEGWDWKGINENQERWFPWFYRKLDNGKVCGLAFAYSYLATSSRNVFLGSRLFVKTEELADYFGKQFIELWREYYLG